MTLDQFRSAFQTGGLQSVAVTAAGGAFLVVGHPRTGETVTLTTTRGKQPRRFTDPGKAIALLHTIGAHKFAVDTANWAPNAETTHRRPDTAERQRRLHQAAEYDAWFRAEVEKALIEADDPATEWVSNEEVKRQSAEDRARWRAQAERR